jgi:hypothetical protein
MVLPAFSGNLAKRTATAAAAPQEMPAKMPSSLARRRAKATASSFVTCSTWSTSDRSSTSGTKPAPMPWILWGAA